MSNKKIDSYIKDVSRHLDVGPLRRRRILAEAKDHLTRSIDQDLSKGEDSKAAETHAIDSFGNPAKVASYFKNRVTNRSSSNLNSPGHLSQAGGNNQAPHRRGNTLAHGALHRYPALTFVAVAAALALLLPSALNIPQSGPTNLAEYAPVPGKGEGESQLTNLSQANSGGLGFGSGLGEGSGPGAGSGLGNPSQRRPKLKRCVGKPPRQTEDPMSPPCVAYFEGSNGGATSRGVSEDEVTIVEVITGGTGLSYTGKWQTAPPSGSVCDLELPPDSGDPGCSDADGRDHEYVQGRRALARYFNDRYQTYARKVHMWLYWYSGPSRSSVDEVVERFKPFAAIDVNNDAAFADGMTSHGVMVFAGNHRHEASYFRKKRGFAWAFMPDAEHAARVYAGYTCTKVARHPVAHAAGGVSKDGTPMNGKPRRYAFMLPTRGPNPEYDTFSDVVRQELTTCGIDPILEVFYPETYGSPQHYGYGSRNVARMQDEDVNTVIRWGEGDVETGGAAESAGYYPELIVSGNEARISGQTQNPNWWRNARGVGFKIRMDSVQSGPGFQACKEGDPSLHNQICRNTGDLVYPAYYMLFKAVQAAGPKLTPKKVDEGLHAIAPTRSTNPYQASCFFDADDYTCVKDAMEIWWDSAPPDESGKNGNCWRMARDGQRFLSNNWIDEDVAFRDGDVCTYFGDPTTAS